MIVPKLFLLNCVFTIFIIGTQASSHWMVTESGLIQPKLDSPFNMVRPYDLLDFLNQEKRWDSIFEIYTDLSSRQVIIDKLWADVERNTNVGIQIAQDEVAHCIEAGNLQVIDWFAALLEDGSKRIPRHEYLLPVPYYGPNTDLPDCKKVSSLTFSMFAFEHLDSLLRRNNLSANPEFVLPELISPVMTLGQFGHWVTNMLHRNSSSWLYYHMASLYWRINGQAPKAIECSRRALHYAPRQYKDIALGSLGMVLHRSGKTKDAVIVLNAAIDHNPKNYVSHFAIANAYSVLGEYNTSIKHYERTLELNPRMDLAAKHKYGALCHGKLSARMKGIKETLNNLREELQEYTKAEATCLKVQAELLRTINHPEEFEYRNLEKTFERMSEITGLNLKDMKVKVDKNSHIKYFFDGLLYNNEKNWKGGIDGIDTIYSLQRLIRYINTNSRGQIEPHPDFSINIKEKIKPPETKTAKAVPREERAEFQLVSEKKPPAADEELTEFETGIFMYPSTITINRNVEDFDKDADWPSNKLCKETAHTFPKNIEAIFPVFLPFENKGIRMMSLLTEKLGVPLSEEYELPWHPPSCPRDKEPNGKTHKPQITAEVVDTGYLRQKLLEYVGDGDARAADHMQDEEIGHRIYVAMKKKLAPRWVVLTLSSLYWRLRGRRGAALSCLRGAARAARARYRDAVLVSLGSVYLELGYPDEALSAAEEAFRINFYEPATNFLIAELNMVRRHRSTQLFHLKQVVRVEAAFMGGLALRLLRAWGCILRRAGALGEMDFVEGEICTEAQSPEDAVCERDGANCGVPYIQCFNKQSDSSALVRLLDESKPRSPDVVDESFFDTLVDNTPSDRGETLAHHANFDNMLTTMGTVVKGCGVNSCASLKPEDLSLQEEDCNYQHLQMGYWLHLVSFSQLLADSDLELPTEISSISISSRKVPECRPPLELDDFYLEKIARVDTEQWRPLTALMHQLQDMFHLYDYGTLGSKIAKYVETHPRWWAGLLAAGWWCGANGRGACAVRCLAAAHTHAPAHQHTYPLRSLVALLHMQSKQQDAKQIAFLSFYMAPKNKIDAFLVAVSHAYSAEYERAVWMFRYALSLDASFAAAKASLHATMCLMFYGEGGGNLVD